MYMESLKEDHPGENFGICGIVKKYYRKKYCIYLPAVIRWSTNKNQRTRNHTRNHTRDPMKYTDTLSAVFLERPNRFVAIAELDGKAVTCHVKNTGRCRELLIPGTPVILQHHAQAAETGRKTEYSLIGVYKNTREKTILVNLDSQAPNQVAWEWLRGKLGRKDLEMSETAGPEDIQKVHKIREKVKPEKPPSTVANLRREVRHGDSRFDLAFEEDGIPAFMEVKGVTLEADGVARFPDAPTERGVKHLRELTRMAAEGYRCYVLFVIAMKGIHLFCPNWDTHPQFGETLAEAAAAGVTVLAYDCLVTPDSLTLDAPVPICLDKPAPA